jgi:hypothetical protein
LVRFFSCSGNTTHIVGTFSLPPCGNYADLLEQP